MDRRNFLKATVATAAGLVVGETALAQAAPPKTVLSFVRPATLFTIEEIRDGELPEYRGDVVTVPFCQVEGRGDTLWEALQSHSDALDTDAGHVLLAAALQNENFPADSADGHFETFCRHFGHSRVALVKVEDGARLGHGPGAWLVGVDLDRQDQLWMPYREYEHVYHHLVPMREDYWVVWSDIGIAALSSKGVVCGRLLPC